ncbi:hypothetical protein KIN20_011537 [Parelaphostrongylus tenuis]|uniref:Uncharacterized protein n=1 Tax=Parelaphostrongylus tenuis TaxID=148309 RepID=A0AAD5M9J2_PARTN|nr:hypothetical protein KIN20_011537 [Parelaphostrongylus tenuis]
MRLVDPSITREQLFQYLQQCARLVQGVWVLQSELLFHDLTEAHSTTVGKRDESRAHTWRCARDLALCMLDFGQAVTRALLIRCFKINCKDAEDILLTFAVSGDKTWKLRIAPDPAFSNSPENARIFLEERRYWVKRWEELRNMVDVTLSLPFSSRTHKDDSPDKPKKNPVRRRMNNSRGSSLV